MTSVALPKYNDFHWPTVLALRALGGSGSNSEIDEMVVTATAPLVRRAGAGICKRGDTQPSGSPHRRPRGLQWETGRACIADDGAVNLGLLASGMTLDEVLANYPCLEREDLFEHRAATSGGQQVVAPSQRSSWSTRSCRPGWRRSWARLVMMRAWAVNSSAGCDVGCEDLGCGRWRRPDRPQQRRRLSSLAHRVRHASKLLLVVTGNIRNDDLVALFEDRIDE